MSYLWFWYLWNVLGGGEGEENVGERRVILYWNINEFWVKLRLSYLLSKDDLSKLKLILKNNRKLFNLSFEKILSFIFPNKPLGQL